MAKYERQHYIPQFWLRAFSDDGDGYVTYYDLSTKKERIESIENLFFYKLLYSDDSFKDKSVVEKTLSAFESDVATFFPLLLHDKEVILTKQGYETLFIFLTIQMFRNKMSIQIDKRRAGEQFHDYSTKKFWGNSKFEIGWRNTILNLAKCRTLKDIMHNDYLTTDFKDYMRISFSFSHINLFEVKGKKNLILSDQLPMLDSNPGKLPLLNRIYYYPISKKRILVICSNSLSEQDVGSMIDGKKFKQPWTNDEQDVQLWTKMIYDKEVDRLNNAAIKFAREGYIK